MLKLIEKEDFMEQKKINYPKKGAARKWSKRLKELGNQPPPEDLMRKINGEENKKVAVPKDKNTDLDV